jgi:hypothetical protein
MGLAEKLRGLLGGDAAPGPGKIRVKVFMSGRFGEGWQSVDRTFTVPAGTTLGGLLDATEREGISLRDAIAQSQHLRQTLMLNGERCPLDENVDRALGDGDQVYLLSPLAGG